MKNVIKEYRAKGITLGGRTTVMLTESKIVKLSGYYRLAIATNKSNLKDMKRAIMATLYHYSSTDEKPQHKFCPKGRKSWCFYQKIED